MENSHIVSRYDKKIERIKSSILDMGDLVISQLDQATDALFHFDATAVDQLIATDRTINGMHKDIYSRAERLIALRQPVALDLRKVLSPINIAGELERIGDHAKSTAKRARVLSAQKPDMALLDMLRDMSTSGEIMLSDVLQAYDTNDTQIAADVRARDAAIDALNKTLFKRAVKLAGTSPERVEAAIHMILLARGFERVGDHVVNITRHVHQIATGEDLKASD